MSVKSQSSHAEGSGGTATVTISASTNASITIDKISLGGEANASGGDLTVTAGSTQIFSNKYITAGPHDHDFPTGLTRSVDGEAVTVVLSGWGISDEVHVNVLWHY